MNTRKRLHSSLAVTLTMLWATSVHAIEPTETDPRKIAAAMEDRDDGDLSASRVTLTLTDASGRTRERKTRQQSKKFKGGTKSVTFFESPADVRNTGLLSIDYDDGKKNDDQWLYLPSLHKSTRIATADKSGSFMGTDITYADMTKKDTSAYDYKMVKQSETIDGEDCWVIEARPRTAKEKKETGYVKTQTWISKSKLLPVQSKAWVTEGKKLKYFKFSKFEKVDGIWVSRQMAVRQVRGGKVDSQTVLKITSIKFNQPGVTEDQFTERRLEQGL